MKMFSLILLGMLLLAGTGSSAEAPPADFYLSPMGADKWSGTLAEPNARGSDGPFATLKRARDAVRVLNKKKKAGDISQAGGCYAGGGNVAIHWRNLSKRESQPETDAGLFFCPASR